MAGSKEIRLKIASTKNMQKITKAMEMVAAGKMRKTNERLLATRPFAHKIKQIITHLAHATTEYRHPYLLEREEKDIGVLVVSSDRGLCGGLNSNLFRMIFAKQKQYAQEGKQVKYGVYGQKAAQFFSSVRAPVIAQKTALGDYPHLSDVLGVLYSLVKMFEAGEISAVYLASNEYVNTMTQKPRFVKVLPITVEGETKEELNKPWDYLYEPDPQTMLDALLKRYIESITFQSIVENIASEQSARMVAMKNASENAGGLIKELQLIYNKARQAAITQELSEIVAGAAAV